MQASERGAPMTPDELILISVDDHIAEPATMFDAHVPDRYRDLAPRVVTDERGIAKVRVAKGAYKLFVSQTRYVTFGLPVEVDGDMTARAELYVEPVTERN